jgi:hypothetical protein
MLPGSIERIGERAFQYCTKLRSVMLSRNINEIGDFAFCECENLENISIPKNVERIGNGVFFSLTDHVLEYESKECKNERKNISDAGRIGIRCSPHNDGFTFGKYYDWFDCIYSYVY